MRKFIFLISFVLLFFFSSFSSKPALAQTCLNPGLRECVPLSGGTINWRECSDTLVWINRTCTTVGTVCIVGTGGPSCQFTCAVSGQSCAATGDCCSGLGLTCNSGRCGVAPTPSCAVSGQSCAATGDCCSGLGLTCNSGRCGTTPTPTPPTSCTIGDRECTPVGSTSYRECRLVGTSGVWAQLTCPTAGTVCVLNSLGQGSCQFPTATTCSSPNFCTSGTGCSIAGGTAISATGCTDTCCRLPSASSTPAPTTAPGMMWVCSSAGDGTCEQIPGTPTETGSWALQTSCLAECEFNVPAGCPICVYPLYYDPIKKQCAEINRRTGIRTYSFATYQACAPGQLCSIGYGCDYATNPSFTRGDIPCGDDGTTCPTALGPINTEPVALVKRFFGVVLSVSGGLAVILIIISGYRFIASRANPEKVQEAKEQLTAAVVGLLFVIFSFTILRFIGVDVLRIFP